MTGRLGRRPDRPRRRAGIRRVGLTSGIEPVAARGSDGEIYAAGAAPVGYSACRITPAAMLLFAREVYNVRRRRSRSLPADLFGEPTWDILLDLYVATRENRPVPTTSACIGAHVPPTTALRWLRLLEARGLVEREDDGRDGRRTFVRLSKQGLAAMEDWLHASLLALDHAVGPILRDSVPMAEAAE